MVNILNECLRILIDFSQLSKTYYNVLFGSFTRDRHVRRRISADVQRITLNASCMTISGGRTKQLDIFCRITGFMSDFLSFIVVGLIQFFHRAIVQLIEEADETLFNNIRHNPLHILHPLLPKQIDDCYSLRPRSHNFELTCNHDNINFMDRMLFRNPCGQLKGLTRAALVCIEAS